MNRAAALVTTLQPSTMVCTGHCRGKKLCWMYRLRRTSVPLFETFLETGLRRPDSRPLIAMQDPPSPPPPPADRGDAPTAKPPSGRKKSDVDDESAATVERPSAFAPLVDNIIVLTGPTASGKTSVAVELAERIGAEILSLDSIAVYRGMDIGTAKPNADARRRVPHHLINLVDPDDEFSVAEYLRAAHQKVADIAARNRQALFVGGTPMFLKGILRGFDPGPPADWSFREAVELDVKRHGSEALHERLRQVDPLAAHRIGPNDTRRMIRALEVARHTGAPMSHSQTQFDHNRQAESCHVFSLQWPRDQLHKRINHRVRKMFDDGLIAEVSSLLSQFGQLSRTASQAVGYREILQWLSEGGDLEEMIQQVSAHTRQLARRQETWFRSFSEIRPMTATDPMQPAAIADEITALIQRN